MEYVKINSLWKRQEYVKGLPKGSHGPLIVGEYSEPEFGAVKRWQVDEKVDGTNIRVLFNKGQEGIEHPGVIFGGRTSNAQLPTTLLVYLQKHFTDERMDGVFPEGGNIVLFGEGYGPKIQGCGGNYRKEVGFILFDVWVSGWWLTRQSVRDIAEKLHISAVPDLGIMTEDQVIEFVKSQPLSLCSIIPQMMEGVVCRSEPLMLFRNGKPLMWKLKCREFE